MPDPDKATPNRSRYHGLRFPVVCPQCCREAYEHARPQVERYLRRQAEAGRVIRSE